MSIRVFQKVTDRENRKASESENLIQLHKRVCDATLQEGDILQIVQTESLLGLVPCSVGAKEEGQCKKKERWRANSQKHIYVRYVTRTQTEVNYSYKSKTRTR